MGKYSKNKGITLIELMIVIVVVAILSSIAVPAYQEHVVRAKRADAKAAILNTANKMEKALYTWGNYNNGGSATGIGAIPGASATSPDGHYSVTLSALTATGYTITASPTGSHSDSKCGNLIYNQAGQKTASTGDNEVCWR